ncbi:MAG: PQQ-dependent sugar dehydrogenase [Cyclobacteriaceae bacterium]
MTFRFLFSITTLCLGIAIALPQCTPVVELPQGDTDNGGLYLPGGFEAVVVIDSIEEKARHIAVNDDGAIYVKLRNSNEEGSIAVLKDTNNNGRADVVKKFGSYGKRQRWSLATGMRIHNGYLYFSSELVVYRYKLDPGSLVPQGEMEIILTDDHEHGRHEHIAKPLSFDNKGNMYVPFGAPSNACQEPKRTPGAQGLNPCPQLEHHAGVWRFDAEVQNQTQQDGYKYATGIRSVVAMDWNPDDENLYIVMHGRDDLLRLFPNIYSPWASAMLPSEEFIKVTEGSDFGWPYCYYDQMLGKKVLAPEYGGDGQTVGDCDQYDDPVIGFPGHWAPNDLVFYRGDQFPERYRNGAFIAFHGSTNRGPYPQSGYFVCFVPFRNGQPSGEWEVFADGFAGVDPIVSVKDAVYRPMGIAVGPDGSLYLAETEKGKIWRVMYKGDKKQFGKEHLAAMEKRKELSHIRTPDKEKDNLMKEQVLGGEKTYYTYCSVCHQTDGEGASGRFPSLAGTDWVVGDKKRLIQVVLNGLEGSIEVNGQTFNGVMPQHSFLSDKDIADVLTYIRSNFGNEASPVDEEEVSQLRVKL